MKSNAEVLREWRKKNPEKRREQKRRYYAKHCERLRQERNNKRAERREEFRAKARGYYARNAEKIRERENQRRASRREHYRELHRQHRANNRALWLLYDVRKRSKKMGMECDLTKEWIEQKFAGVCELSGTAFDMVSKRGVHTPTIDRINPSGPYTQANCRMIIWFLNRALCNYGQEYCFGIFKAVLDYQGGAAK